MTAPHPPATACPTGAGNVGYFLRQGVSSSDGALATKASKSGFGGSLSHHASVLPEDTALGMHAIKTFIVEDSPIILDNLVATLEELASVTVVGSAPDESTAVQRLGQLDDLDLVIIDVFLKSGSGLEVLRNATRCGSSAKRVVLTNYATPNMREKCRLLGAHRVFDKSNELDDLIAYCTRLAEATGGLDPSN